MFMFKPCPFCGGPARLIQRTNGMSSNPNTIKNAFVVGCDHCKIYTPYCESKIWQDSAGVIHIDQNGAELAKQMWDGRAENADRHS